MALLACRDMRRQVIGARVRCGLAGAPIKITDAGTLAGIEASELALMGHRADSHLLEPAGHAAAQGLDGRERLATWHHIVRRVGDLGIGLEALNGARVARR